MTRKRSLVQIQYGPFQTGGIENARLTETEQRWIEAGGGTETNAISNVQGVASQIRSRPEYVRFTDAESTLKRQREGV